MFVREALKRACKAGRLSEEGFRDGRVVVKRLGSFLAHASSSLPKGARSFHSGLINFSSVLPAIARRGGRSFGRVPRQGRGQGPGKSGSKSSSSSSSSSGSGEKPHPNKVFGTGGRSRSGNNGGASGGKKGNAAGSTAKKEGVGEDVRGTAALGSRSRSRATQGDLDLLKGPAARTMMMPRTFLGGASISEACGHMSFLLLGVSFAFQDIMYLRVTALFAGATMAVFNFFHPYGRVLWLPFRWNLFFIGVNVLNISWIMSQQYAANHMSAEESQLYEQVK